MSEPNPLDLLPNHVYCGDCVNLLCTAQQNFVDLVLTSPPYDNLRKYNGYEFSYKRVAELLFRVVKLGGVVVWVVGDETKNGSESGTSFEQALYFKKVGFKLYDTMIYRKINYVPLTHRRYEQEFEYMFVFSKGTPKAFNAIMVPCKNAGSATTKRTFYQSSKDNEPSTGHKNESVKFEKQHGNIFEYSTKMGVKGHPAQFPEQLAIDQINTWTDPGDLVLDVMCGAGTTLVAAKKMGRDYIGIDVSEEYCLLSHKRLEDLNVGKG